MHPAPGDRGLVQAMLRLLWGYYVKYMIMASARLLPLSGIFIFSWEHFTTAAKRPFDHTGFDVSIDIEIPINREFRRAKTLSSVKTFKNAYSMLFWYSNNLFQIHSFWDSRESTSAIPSFYPPSDGVFLPTDGINGCNKQPINSITFATTLPVSFSIPIFPQFIKTLVLRSGD